MLLRAVLGRDARADAEIVGTLEDVLALYPEHVRRAEHLDVDAPRFAEQAAWIREASAVLDIGGGYSPFAPLCARLGMRAVVVDVFGHGSFAERADVGVRLQDAGVELVQLDPLTEPLPFAEGSFDAVTTFETMEHWHHSPRRLFAEVVRVIRPGGLFVNGVPNAVNLRKRVAVPLGKSNWSRFEDWYLEPTFWGHVREPTVSDLERIAEDMRLAPWVVVGRNWLGYQGGRRRAVATRLVDPLLRLRPSLCANLYLIGRIP